MKIMQITSGSAVNGAVHHCLLLSREMVRRGHAVTMLCRPGAWIGEQVKPYGIKVIHSDLHRWPSDELRRIAAILNARGYDVINTHMSRAHFFGVLLRMFTRVPCVATAHSRRFQPHWVWNDMVIAVSEASRQYHRRVNRVRDRRIVTIRNSIDEARFEKIDPTVRREVRESLGIADSELLVSVVANVIPDKGQIYVIRALPEILTTVPGMQVVFAGDLKPTYHQRVCREADRLGVGSHIQWLGLRNDIPELLAASDLFVLPSLEEALGLSILEAMAVGLPTVATTVGGIGECVAHGETGLLVPPRDHVALGRAITELLLDSDTRKRMGEAARRRVQEEFSTDKQTAAIESVFERVASRLPARRAA